MPKLSKGQRVRTRSYGNGVIVKVTHGHALYKVWLDRPYKEKIGGRQFTAYLLHASKRDVEPTDEAEPRFMVRPPEWKTEADFYRRTRGQLEITDSGEVIESAVGARAAYTRVARHEFKQRMKERRKARQEKESA